MQRTSQYIVTGFIVLSGIAIFTRVAGFQFSTIIFPGNATTSQDIQNEYNNSRLSLLIVPGHDLEYPGTEFRGTKEADLTIQASVELYNFLKNDPHIHTSSARVFSTGDYQEELKSYFSNEQVNIRSFSEKFKNFVEGLTAAGNFLPKESKHPVAPDVVALRLTGINKWANEHHINVVIHIHFNDYPDRRFNVKGRYHGFVIYVPDSQYPNYQTSQGLGQFIFEKLRESAPVSNYASESSGLVEDQQLLAIGPYATREGASLLIEYGYIYEPQLVNPDIRERVIRELAYQTYRGIETYFGNKERLAMAPSTFFPYKWQYPLQEDTKRIMDVFFLQTALSKEGLYPPPGKTINTCPFNGLYGPCTKQSVRLFQKKYFHIAGNGIVGPATRKKLNELYGK